MALIVIAHVDGDTEGDEPETLSMVWLSLRQQRLIFHLLQW